ncbi:solute carrier family 25 member 47-B isoform X2 [Brienomyrus brachyistius]|uniref:solute carrier family 25 member 47-B isoform X2 n=1 Tax=Brienomyrus brachyistius TaxID=42636 RepID=UPI0020B3CB64|nr:solute carrier family 25 member 47-B isoform X2 [Brienomyrus brachyistius]
MHFADFIAGSIGGALGVAVGYPLDTVKVRIQTQRKFTGVWHCVHSTCKAEGVNGFYKGISMPVTTVSISSSVVFGIYRNCLQGLCMLRGGGADTPPHKLDIFLSGLAAGVAQVSVMSPADIVKVQLQCQTEPYLGSSLDSKPKYRGPIHCLLTIAREQGLLGLYKGAGALALRDGSSFATYFLTYNVVCGWLTPVGQKQPDWAVIMLAGGVSGMCGWSLGTPMDVIKARLQVDSVTQRRYRGFVHCVTESVRQEGPGVLFRGLGLNCLRAFPVNMAVFWAYELVLRFLRPAP